MIHLLFISYLRSAADSLFGSSNLLAHTELYTSMEDAFKWISGCLIEQNQQCSFAQDELRLFLIAQMF